MSLFLAVSIAIVLAAFFGLVARVFKQPLILGYLFAGIVLAAFGVFSGENRMFLEGMAEFGVTFLLFLVGLEMRVRELPAISRIAILVALGQTVFTVLLGFLLASLLGFAPIAAFYIAVAIAFSSTIIAVQLLSSKKDLASLYAKIAVGVLLVQNLVVILVLMFLSGFQDNSLTLLGFVWVFLKGILLLGVVFLLSRTLLPKFFDKVASQGSELLFLASIAWALLLSGIVTIPQIGFSTIIGGFLAGLSLANSSEHLQIASRVKPLRDFFITIFFLLLGAEAVAGWTPGVLIPAIVLSAFVLLGKPLAVLVVMGLLRHKSRTSFLTATTLSQVSEFSFKFVMLGAVVGHIEGSVVSLVILVGVITMTISSYVISNGQRLYQRLKTLLRVFEYARTRESALSREEKFKDHIVLIGSDRTGTALLPVLKKREEDVVVVDFNPVLIEHLTAEGYKTVFGDSSDVETLDKLCLEHAKLVISTVGHLEDDLVLLEKVRGLRRRPVTSFIADSAHSALKLYEAGADYVVVPQSVGGEHLAQVLNSHGIDKEHFAKLRSRHFDRLVKNRFA